MSKYRSAFLATLLFLPLFAHAAEDEKNLRGRLGVGFTNQIATTAEGTTIPALSAKYYMSKGFATSVGTGFDTRTNGSTVALALKLFKNVFTESNLIFYFGGGLAYINRRGNKLQSSLFFGSEFFIPQVPSLGLTMEAGVRGDSMSGSFAVRTIGDSFLTGGMHFYF